MVRKWRVFEVRVLFVHYEISQRVVKLDPERPKPLSDITLLKKTQNHNDLLVCF